jgi:hypothetical protein
LIGVTGVALALVALAVAQEDEKASFDFAESQEQVMLGQSSKMVAYGDQLNIQSLEVTPAAGITIQELKEQPPEPEDARQNKPGVRVWSFVVVANKAAQPGKRSVVAVTPHGRSHPGTFFVVTHVPVISNVVITSTDPSGVVDFHFAVTDAAADVSPKAVPHVFAFLYCANSILGSMGPADKVVMKDARHGTVYHQAKFQPLGQQVTIHPGSCALQFSIRDDGGVLSNELKANAEFK